MSSLGLRDVPTKDLERLLRAVFHGEPACPLKPSELARLGFQDRQESLLATLRGLDARAVQAVLVAVIAERR